ncbi:PepSY-associated TM helix domain-containing protein [Spirosoma rhododendri]|uniref:PepSY domain-containing protein n=1 Tax=Spirosoma rhododendri TaxID=2728024 RepID=A0A7L5DMI5_9BACT|nr:PepSY-associated TM helix domain-containing protein [Spirosoma rhododendri]QJD79616.1 PepSY domain-containing protein [Spirosoma rhododendri]
MAPSTLESTTFFFLTYVSFLKKATRWSFRLHSWLGLATGLFLLLFGLTGSALVFRPELDRWANPELHQLTPGPTTVSIDRMYRMLVRRYPNLTKIVLHDFPQGPADSYEFMLYRNLSRVQDAYLYFVVIDPYTGRILREGGYDEIGPSFWRWLNLFHYSFQAGAPGKLLGAVLGVTMILSLLTGLVIYRKHVWNVLRFRERINWKNRHRALSSLHRVVGVWSLLFNVLLFGTGLVMNATYFDPATWRLKPPIQNQVVPVSLDALLSRSKQRVPGFEPIAINIPTTAGQPILVRGHFPQTTFFLYQGKASHIAFDAQTGQLLTVDPIEHQPFGKRFHWASYQAHIGLFGGLPIRWLYVVLGLTPGLLSLTGAWLWYRRTRFKRQPKLVAA